MLLVAIDAFPRDRKFTMSVKPLLYLVDQYCLEFKMKRGFRTAAGIKDSVSKMRTLAAPSGIPTFLDDKRIFTIAAIEDATLLCGDSVYPFANFASRNTLKYVIHSP